MSDVMQPLSFADLLNRIRQEKKEQGTIFGVHPFCSSADCGLQLFGQSLEMPFGPAAGPHTQLAQNIIAAYCAGSRFFELKTVQTLDGADLPVAKPCIFAADEGYNVEWSTELRVAEALREYIHAWFAIKLIAKEYGLGDPEGIIFNMSVGYDYEGIRSPKIDRFIEGLKNATNTEIWQECCQISLDQLPRFKKVDAAYIKSISPKICNSITLSTLHGCPPQEIERISQYLISEKKLNTYIKCNPTLLGYNFARQSLEQLGYDYLQFDDHHFLDDLQYADAVPMFQRLLAKSEESGLSFGVKLSNTFPVDIAQNELPGKEMYMSGRALYPLTIHLCERLSQEFEGKLLISFSGGGDYFNIPQLFEAGIWPITLATSLLKPGGYQRLTQIAEALAKCEYSQSRVIDQAKVAELAKNARQSTRYQKNLKPHTVIKAAKKVPLLDCFVAPCQEGCPIGQDVPAYVGLVSEERYEDALKVILSKNPLPFITGTICNHRCMTQCVRNYYEESIQIRDTKLIAAQKGLSGVLPSLKLPKSERAKGRVAIVGGGPAGLATATFLRRAGLQVTIFEKEETLGGIVRQVIPEFRIAREAIEQDLQLLEATGCEICLNTVVKDVQALFKEGFEHVVLAIGARQPSNFALEQGEIIHVLDFLEQYKADPRQLQIGKHVVVIGGGNTAMDAARAAGRVAGVEKVSLVYRRNRRNMPADEEELSLALAEGVEFCELMAPVALINGVLTCRKMILGEPDDSGRRRPLPTAETVTLLANSVISATGEQVDAEFYRQNGLSLDKHQRPIVDEATGQTNMAQLYLVGDGRRGPATVVEAIADAAMTAQAIIDAEGLAWVNGLENSSDSYLSSYHHKIESIRGKKGYLRYSDPLTEEGQRCLECATICEACVDVCPNRANVAIRVPGDQMTQIIHLDGLCNECGNCATFCPYDSAPYKEKWTLFDNLAGFEDSENEGFVLLDQATGLFKIRLQGTVFQWDSQAPAEAPLPQKLGQLLIAVLQDYPYYL